MLLEVTTAASDLGAIQDPRRQPAELRRARIMDAIDRGIGQLVDADMQEESARLSALQVQAAASASSPCRSPNSNAQNILSLFR